MRLVGRLVSNTSLKVLGICPEHFCIYPGVKHELDPTITYTCLECHHTHIVLVDSKEWGGETNTIAGVIQTLSKKAKGCAILINGGPISKNEISVSVKAGIPIVVMKGS